MERSVPFLTFGVVTRQGQAVIGVGDVGVCLA